MAKPENPYVWHKYEPWFFVRLNDGTLSFLLEPVLRRKKPDGRWEYSKREETFDEWQDRQW